jgi:hypothetical protein
MVSIVVILKGFILAIIFTIALTVLGIGSVIGLSAVMLGFFIAGIVVGYISYGDLVEGTINGALMGVIGAIIFWILSLFKGQIAAFSAQLSNYVPLNSLEEIIILIVVGGIGGAIGALILRLNRRNMRKK